MDMTLQHNLLIKAKIMRVLNVFETGKPEGNYAAIARFFDGPGRKQQITYGRSQTTEYGNLVDLVEMYVARNGQYAAQLKPYLPKIGRVALVNDFVFIKLLQDAAKNDPVMKETQDDFFAKFYFWPAFEWFEKNGFNYPLSLLVIYDSFIHSGGILSHLRNNFPATVPVKGGEEKAWITQYANARDKWLEEHGNKILRNTDYRTDSFIYAIRQNNWQLDQPFKIVNYLKNDESDNPVIRQTVS